MKRVSKAPAERRAELVTAARRLFDERGIQKTRVSDIVGEVGVAQGVFYYYFSSKDEMVAEVVKLVNHEVQSRAEAIMAAEGDFYSRLAAFIELYIDMIDQFLADDETSLQPLENEDHLLGGFAAQNHLLLSDALCRLVQGGAAEGCIQAQYPLQTAMVLLYGLRRLALDELPSRHQLYTIVEQALVLPKGRLVRHV